MNNILFPMILAVIVLAVLTIAFKKLPQETWQILAAIPTVKNGTGQWEGVNLTWYGVLTANAYVSGVGLLFVLMGSVGIDTKAAFAVIAVLLLVCVPASRIMAMLVEKKPYTFTVAGASFVGTILAPWTISLLNKAMGNLAGFEIHTVPALSALAISYAFGEGLGRLACISFGCCYGKTLSSSPEPVRRLFRKIHFVFSGPTKKISYAGGLEGEPVLPVQAMTSVLYIGIALVGISFYLNTWFLLALTVCVVVTQGWRVVSEVFRADFRGGGKMTPYQIMSLVAMVYLIAAGIIFDSVQQPLGSPGWSMPATDITAGLRSIWNPGMLLFLEGFWGAMFIYTGRSMVTGSSLSFYVHKSRI